MSIGAKLLKKRVLLALVLGAILLVTGLAVKFDVFAKVQRIGFPGSEEALHFFPLSVGHGFGAGSACHFNRMIRFPESARPRINRRPGQPIF